MKKLQKTCVFQAKSVTHTQTDTHTNSTFISIDVVFILSEIKTDKILHPTLYKAGHVKSLSCLKTRARMKKTSKIMSDPDHRIVCCTTVV